MGFSECIGNLVCHYVKTGQHADIIERAMVEIFEFQQPDPPFDKKEASKVFCVLFICMFIP